MNGYLNFDIEFLEDLTFVTGINGSGKTTVLNAITALLLPRFDYLVGEDFDSISVDIIFDEEQVTLTAKTTDPNTLIQCSKFPSEEFKIAEFVPSEPMPAHRLQEYEEEHYGEILVRHSDHPIIDFIQRLPAPMYLGLDRRALSVSRNRLRYGGRQSATRRRVRGNVFGRSLEGGLSDALYFARDYMQEVRHRELAHDVEFREKLVLSLIEFPPISFGDALTKTPSKSEQRRFAQAKTNLNRLPTLLNVDKDVIFSKIDPIIAFLDQTLEKILQGGGKSGDSRIASYEWSFNRVSIDKISTLSEMISEYNNEADVIQKRIRDYLTTINGFMSDSGKQIIFNNVGDLRFILENDNEKQERYIQTLSSGEIQLIVILTHLYFNPEVKTANVFIIDEPELSLHVQWQEKFVDGLMEAAQATQFILATHSPTIILDRLDNCREVSQV